MSPRPTLVFDAQFGCDPGANRTRQARQCRGDPGDQPGLLLVVEAAGAAFVAEARQAIDPVFLIQPMPGADGVVVQQQNLGDGRVSHATIQQNQSIRTARQPIGRQPVPSQLNQVTSRSIVQKTLPLHPRTRIPLAPFGKPYPNSHRIGVYIKTNAGSLINYGERYRAGERISSFLAESTVNTVISKRFATRQQMQWTKRGAHLLLQTRTRALDGTLRPLFERWYPGLANDNTAGTAQVAAA